MCKINTFILLIRVDNANLEKIFKDFYVINETYVI